MEVAKLVTKGLKNREIGKAIGTSENVVKNYMRQIYDKRGFDNRIELAIWILHEFPEELNLLSK